MAPVVRLRKESPYQKIRCEYRMLDHGGRKPALIWSLRGAEDARPSTIFSARPCFLHFSGLNRGNHDCGEVAFGGQFAENAASSPRCKSSQWLGNSWSGATASSN